MELNNTGERPILETKFENINPVLQCAYSYAAKKARGKAVMDYGCGGGYGIEYISHFTTKETVGFDIDKKTIAINKQFYKSVRNLSFTTLLNKKKKFDMVVSFQVIEHIKDSDLDKYLKDIKTMYLKKGGIFLVATVNKNISSYKLKKSILPFHEHEFFPEELKDILKKYYKSVILYGQIDNEMYDRVKKNKFSFDKVQYSSRFKLIRFLSQIEPVRIIARHIPLFLKNIFTQSKEEDRSLTYKLYRNQKIIDNSYVILCECS